MQVWMLRSNRVWLSRKLYEAARPTGLVRRNPEGIQVVLADGLSCFPLCEAAEGIAALHRSFGAGEAAGVEYASDGEEEVFVGVVGADGAFLPNGEGVRK